MVTILGVLISKIKLLKSNITVLGQKVTIYASKSNKNKETLYIIKKIVVKKLILESNNNKTPKIVTLENELK
jgi:hypothetical protein